MSVCILAYESTGLNDFMHKLIPEFRYMLKINFISALHSAE